MEKGMDKGMSKGMAKGMVKGMTIWMFYLFSQYLQIRKMNRESEKESKTLNKKPKKGGKAD